MSMFIRIHCYAATVAALGSSNSRSSVACRCCTFSSAAAGEDETASRSTNGNAPLPADEPVMSAVSTPERLRCHSKAAA